MNRKNRIITLTILLWLAVGSLIAIGGDLNPPAGPVLGTMKPLTDIEPRIAINSTNTPGDANSLFKITSPGSYYLTGNVTGVVGKHGIEIVTSGVTLDLMGFDLVGVVDSVRNGIFVSAGFLNNITVRNGSVRGWGRAGVEAVVFAADNCTVLDVCASGNDVGITVGGKGSALTGCLTYNNTGHGFYVGFGCTMTRCSAIINGTNGFYTSSACTITGCTAYLNAGTGISTGGNCTITGCAAFANSGNGIEAIGGSTITGCAAGSNTGDGIWTNIGSTITGCTAGGNAGTGITAVSGCTASNCTATSNTLDGIVVSHECMVLANTCSSNGSGAGDGAGIHATGIGNRIEGNTCSTADRGIDVDGSGNIIIRNTCSGNTTNWDIVANNVYGPIIDRTVPTSPAVSGNSAASSLGSTDPNANFSY